MNRALMAVFAKQVLTAAAKRAGEQAALGLPPEPYMAEVSSHLRELCRLLGHDAQDIAREFAPKAVAVREQGRKDFTSLLDEQANIGHHKAHIK